MATISIQVTETGFPNATKTYTLPDSQIDRLIVAYQSPANVSVNGTATRAQVLNYWANKLMQDTTQYIQGTETGTAQTAAAAGVTPITPV